MEPAYEKKKQKKNAKHDSYKILINSFKRIVKKGSNKIVIKWPKKINVR